MALTGAELKQDNHVIGRVMLRAPGRVVVETNRKELKRSLENGVVGRNKKRYTPADGVDFVRAVIFQFSGSRVRALAIHNKPRDAAAKPLSIHFAADSFIPRLSITFRHAFAVGRKTLRATRDADAAAKAVEKALGQTLQRALLDVVAAGGEVGASVVGLRTAEFRTAKRDPKPTIKFKFSSASPEVIKWAKKHAADLIADVSETSRKRIRRVIAELTEGGKDWNEALEQIEAAVGDEDRAERIARHETMTAASEGQRQAWHQAVDEGLLPEDAVRTWITVGDDKVCPICAPLDGKTADLDGEYEDGIGGPPAHVTCRCTEGIA